MAKAATGPGTLAALRRLDPRLLVPAYLMVEAPIAGHFLDRFGDRRIVAAAAPDARHPRIGEFYPVSSTHASSRADHGGAISHE